MWHKISRDERIQCIKDGVSRGLSASKIAAEIGGCSRNSVIGLAARAKIQLAESRPAGRPTGARPPKRAIDELKEAKVRPEAKNAVNVKVIESVSRRQYLRANLDVIIPVSRELELIQLTERTCKWPHGSADFSFCGNDVVFAPYCSYHSRIAYQPAEERKRR
ncbi:GcrA cell cycle regulator [Mesorhizobium sp. L-8-10]|uniref:GcrA family cell cycle regulator n=1 Tax=Mesorhizobium sp. L-8-10 TaxID=2744523 RepID=UPI001926E7BC|nr:GcrA family cell cycle regulator [Mesorhizobium sp. L-8-10]BCH33227.1 GcrA cell cycle regulator [Mesorhizobium sp. L-8-10]